MDTKRIVAVLIFFAYLAVGVLTLKDYGISWDEPVHFRRGQAYLHYFLTGELNYQALPPYNLYKAQTDPNYHQRSFYQVEDIFHSGKNIKELDMGHPPLSDIVAAAFNFIFYQKLGWLGDIEAYHLYEIVVSALLVGVVFLFAAENFNIWSGLLSAILLATYPLFWAESHFNIKDPAETAFFTISLFLFWKAVSSKNYKWIVASAISAGFALGTKFNIVFLPIILGFWLITKLLYSRKEMISIIKSKVFISFSVLFPVITFLVFFVGWPYLWRNPLHNVLAALNYYEKVGTGAGYQPSFMLGPLNFYPITWMAVTTPPATLLLFLLGLFVLIKNFTKHKDLSTLSLLWLVIPIARVSISGFSIYGGVRQIMEYIPALSIIAAVGGDYLRRAILGKSEKQGIRIGIIILIIVLIANVFPLVKLHPYENVYFNFSIGGVSGAIGKNIPAAGNTLGNVYKQGIEWINQSVPQGAKLSLIQGTTSNLPLFKIRPDINYSNYNWSGINRGGEYLMDLTYNYDNRSYNYAWEYVDKLLEPVYEVKIDGVAILKIWKNDLEHTKPQFKGREVKYLEKIPTKTGDKEIFADLPTKVSLSRVKVNFQGLIGCLPLKFGYVETSQDGSIWQREKDWIPFEQVGRKKDAGVNYFTFYLSAREARYIKIIVDDSNSCVLKNPSLDVYTLD